MSPRHSLNLQGQLVWLVTRAWCWPSGFGNAPHPLASGARRVDEPGILFGLAHHPGGSATAAVQEAVGCSIPHLLPSPWEARPVSLMRLR